MYNVPFSHENVESSLGSPVYVGVPSISTLWDGFLERSSLSSSDLGAPFTSISYWMNFRNFPPLYGENANFLRGLLLIAVPWCRL